MRTTSRRIDTSTLCTPLLLTLTYFTLCLISNLQLLLFAAGSWQCSHGNADGHFFGSVTNTRTRSCRSSRTAWFVCTAPSLSRYNIKPTVNAMTSLPSAFCILPSLPKKIKKTFAVNDAACVLSKRQARRFAPSLIIIQA